LLHPVEQEIQQTQDTENTSELHRLQQQLQKADDAQLQQQLQKTKSNPQGQCCSVSIPIQ